MKRKIFFRSSKGNRICGILSAKRDSKSIVIMVHGFTSGKDRPKMRFFEKMFNKKGIATLRIDLFGHGESSGTIRNLTVSECVDDVLSAVKLAEKKGFTATALIGSSLGGFACLLAASRKKGLACLGLIAPLCDFNGKGTIVHRMRETVQEWKKKGYGYYQRPGGRDFILGYQFYADGLRHKGYSAAKRITAPAIIVHGTKDDSVPLSQSKKTSMLMKNCTLMIMRGADHRFSRKKDSQLLIRTIVSFISDKLRH